MRSLLAVPKALSVPVLNGVRPGPGGPASIIAVLNCELSGWRYLCKLSKRKQANENYIAKWSPMSLLHP